MSSPMVSVVIPAYNQADYLAKTVQTVLDQTLTDLEIIVVNDASTDHTDDVMGQFDDPRIHYLIHENNRYAAAARNTGIQAASGEYIAFLDADDLMHPGKLQAQVAFLEADLTVGLSYTYRLIIDGSGSPLFIETNPPNVNLADLVMGYPFCPSEVVMRKEWAYRVRLFDESFIKHGEDPDFHMRLASQGCKMAGLGRAFNYRRLLPNRIFSNLAGIIDDEVRAFERTFADPYCPPEIVALRAQAMGKLYLGFAILSFFQDETEMARELVLESNRLEPSMLENEGRILREALIHASVRNGGEHEDLLRRAFDQLPSELAWLSQYAHSAVARGYLIRGVRDIMWGRTKEGVDNLDKVSMMGAQLDESFLRFLTTHLLNFNAEFGDEETDTILQDLNMILIKYWNRGWLRRLNAQYWINHAFRSYKIDSYDEVPGDVLRAIKNNPLYLADRGVLSMLIRTMGGLAKPELQ